MEIAKERHQETTVEWYLIKDADTYAIPKGDFQPSSLKIVRSLDRGEKVVRFELDGVFTDTGDQTTQQWYSNSDTPDWLTDLFREAVAAWLDVLSDEELERRIDEIKEAIRVAPFRTDRAREEFRHLAWAFDGTGKSPRQVQASIIYRWVLPDLNEVYQYDVIRGKAKNIFFPSAD